VSRPSTEEEESMGGIDWTNIPLRDFYGVDEEQEDGTVRLIAHPHGDGAAQRLMVSIHIGVQGAYEDLLSLEDGERYETAGEVPVIRDGRKGHERFDSLTLADLPAILDTLAAMDEEVKALEAEEAARFDAERKRRRNARARERRKLKKLGEW
jgi:hypothetical protein